MPPDRSELRWRPVLQLTFGLSLLALFFYVMAPFLIPMLLGGVIALLCFPLQRRICTRYFPRMPRGIAAGIVTLAVSALVLLPIGFILLNAVQQLVRLISTMNVQEMARGSGPDGISIADRAFGFLERFVPVERQWLDHQLATGLSTALETLSRVLGNFLASVPGFLLNFFVLILAVYFFLVDGEKFLRFMSRLSLMSMERSSELYRSFEGGCRGVVLGLFASAGAQGILILFFFLITRIPNAFLFGVLSIVLGFVPIVGTAPVTIGALIYLFVQHKLGMFVVMAIGAVLIATVDNIVRPWAMKGQNEMHPMLALVSAFGATNLIGPTGIFLGPIIAAVFVSFLKIMATEAKS